MRIGREHSDLPTNKNSAANRTSVSFLRLSEILVMVCIAAPAKRPNGIYMYLRTSFPQLCHVSLRLTITK